MFETKNEPAAKRLRTEAASRPARLPAQLERHITSFIQDEPSRVALFRGEQFYQQQCPKNRRPQLIRGRPRCPLSPSVRPRAGCCLPVAIESVEDLDTVVTAATDTNSYVRGWDSKDGPERTYLFGPPGGERPERRSEFVNDVLEGQLSKFALESGSDVLIGAIHILQAVYELEPDGVYHLRWPSDHPLSYAVDLIYSDLPDDWIVDWFRSEPTGVRLQARRYLRHRLAGERPQILLEYPDLMPDYSESEEEEEEREEESFSEEESESDVDVEQ